MKNYSELTAAQIDRLVEEALTGDASDPWVPPYSTEWQYAGPLLEEMNTINLQSAQGKWDCAFWSVDHLECSALSESPTRAICEAFLRYIDSLPQTLLSKS